MGRNLTGQTIASTYEGLVQISGSILTDGTGSNIDNLTVSASYATNASTATSAATAATATTASYILGSNVSGTVASATSAATATSASYALTASFALNGGGGGAVATGSLLTTASISDATITFTKGDASTFNITVNNVSSSISASYATSASQAQNAVNANAATVATTAASAATATTASYALTATTAAQATVAASATTASYIQGGNVSGAVALATTASYASTAASASHATNASNAYVNVSAANVDYHVTFNTNTAGYKQLLQETEAAQFTYNPSNNKLTVENVAATSLSGSVATVTSVTASGITTDTLTANSASIGHLTTTTGSIVKIGDAFVLLNTGGGNRYAGLLVEDSGSAPTNYTASWFFDSLLNDWNYEYTTTASTDYAVALFGPAYGTKGTPTYLTANKVPVASGSHHLIDSAIEDNGSSITLGRNTQLSNSSLSLTDGLSSDLTLGANGDSIAFTSIDDSSTQTIQFVDSGFSQTGTVSFDPSNGNLSISSTGTTTFNGNATTATSASYATTASVVLNAPSPFPFTGSAVITGSLLITGSSQITTGTDPTVYSNNTNSLILASNAAVTRSLINHERSIVGGITMGSYLGGEKYGVTGSKDSIIFGLEGGNYQALAVNAVTGSAIIAAGYKVQVGSGFGNTGDVQYSAMVGSSGVMLGGMQNSGMFGAYNSNLYGNSNLGYGMTIVGGNNHTLNRSQYSSIFGGNTNSIPNAFVDNIQIFGGSSNTVTGGGSQIVGGNSNSISGGTYPSIMGSINSSITSAGSHATIVASRNNTINGGDTVYLVGGQGNTMTDGYISTIFGGNNNTINTGTNNNQGAGNIFGGYGNTISGNGLGISEIFGGRGHHISGSSMSGSAILGGFDSYIGNLNGAIVIGSNITASQAFTVHLDNTIVSGSLRGEVGALTIASTTASMDCSTANFFTLTLANGVDTHLDATNVQVGQTINLKLTNNATSAGTISFDTSVFKFEGGTAFTATAATNAVDVMTFISFDGSTLQATGLKNFS